MHSASNFTITCVYCDAAGTIFATTDVYELSFSYLSISILPLNATYNVEPSNAIIHRVKLFWLDEL